MARINVNPTRMELKKLKARLKTAQRGHKLLKDKTDEMVRRFAVIVRETKRLHDEVEAEVVDVLRQFSLASGSMCKKEIALPLEDLCAAASRCLKFGGRFALIHRADRLAELVYTLHARRLEVKKIRPVCGKAGDKPYAVLVAAVKGGKPGTELLPALVNEKE